MDADGELGKVGKAKRQKRYPIREKGVWSLWGLLAKAEDRNRNTAEQVVNKGMLVLYPSKKSVHGSFLKECNEVYSHSNLMTNYRPKAIVGSKGNWVAFGPMDHGMFVRMLAEFEWEALSRHLMSVFGNHGCLMHVKAVVHVDGTRSEIGWNEIPKRIPCLELHYDDSDTDAEAYVVDYEDYAPQPDDVDHGHAGEPAEEDQALITDFFRPKEKRLLK